MDTWGMVPKAQDDPTTIDQAIATAIANHEADTNAHIDEGESLYNHKNSETIDHLAGSIVNDKYGPYSVTPDLFDFNTLFLRPGFWSLDGIGQIQDGDSELNLYGSALRIVPGSTDADEVGIYLDSPLITVGTDTDVDFYSVIDFSTGPEYVNVRFGAFDYDPFPPSQFVGFEWDGDAGKMYAVVETDDYSDSQEIVGFDEADTHKFRVVVRDFGETLIWYIDDVVVWSVLNESVYVESDVFFCVTVQSIGDASGVDVWVLDWIYLQQYPYF